MYALLFTLSLAPSSLSAAHFSPSQPSERVRSSAALNVLSEPYRPSVPSSMVWLEENDAAVQLLMTE